VVSTAFKHEKTRTECEIELIYNLYRKNFEMSDKNVPIHIKKAHDFEKWKRKFFNAFTREKLIDFCGNPNTVLD
jgi:hypothetical protein